MNNIQAREQRRRIANEAFQSPNPRESVAVFTFRSRKKPRTSFKLGDYVEGSFILKNVQEIMGGQIMKILENDEYDVKFCDGETLRMPFADLRKCHSTLVVSSGEIPFVQGQKVEVKKDFFWVKGKFIIVLLNCIFMYVFLFCFNLILGYIVKQNENEKSAYVLLDNGVTEKVKVSLETIKHFQPYRKNENVWVRIDGVDTNAWVMDVEDNDLLDIVVFNSNESSLYFGISQCRVKRPMTASPLHLDPTLIRKYTLERNNKIKESEFINAKLNKPIEEVIELGMVVEALYDKDSNLFFKGKVLSLNMSSKCATILFEDKTASRDLPFEFIRHFKQYQIGEFIQALWTNPHDKRSNPVWYPARIVSLLNADCYEVVYNDCIRGKVKNDSIARSRGDYYVLKIIKILHLFVF